MATTNITIKLLIDTDANKVVFAEASKDFVDLLFFLLSLPIATVIKLVTCESMVGSIANLYTSFANLNQSNLQPNIHKNLLLNPGIFSPVTDIPLFINKSSILSPGNFYTCCQCHYEAHITNMFYGAYCPSCGRWMKHETDFVAASETGTTVAPLTGYVNEMITYMVSDDLSVTTLSTLSIISMTNKCNAYKLEERKVNIGTKEALELLKISFQSSTVLSEVFLGRRQGKSKARKVEDLSTQYAKEMEEKIERLQSMVKPNDAPRTRARISHDELQEAWIELIHVFHTLPGGTDIGIKEMGVIDKGPFEAACKRKYGAESEWGVMSFELVSQWQHIVLLSYGHQFKTTFTDQDVVDEVDEDDIRLKELRNEFGDEVHNAVVKASREINKYAPTWRRVVTELWNFKKDTKATLKEAIECLYDQLKTAVLGSRNVGRRGGIFI